MKISGCYSTADTLSRSQALWEPTYDPNDLGRRPGGSQVIGSLCPSEGEPPQFLQLYIYDTDNEVDNFQLFRTACEIFADAHVPDIKDQKQKLIMTLFWNNVRAIHNASTSCTHLTYLYNFRSFLSLGKTVTQRTSKWITQELNELRAVPTIINSHLENIGHVHIPFPPPVPFEQLLDVFINPPDVLEMDDSDSDSEFIDTPLVSPFLDSDEELDDEEVLNELNEYGNAENNSMPRAIPRLKNFEWSKIPPIVVLSQWDLMRGLKHPHEKNKLMYKNCLNLGPEYQVDEDMKEWLICKTFLWKTIIYALCSEGKIVLAVASSSIASLLLPAGRIAHSRFKLPLDLTDASGNMQEADMERVSSFAQWRLDIGDGLTGTPDEIDPENTSWVNIREHYCIPDDENRVSNLINFIYDDNTLRHPTTKELQKKTIVCPKNETTDIINAKVMSMLSGNTHTYMRRGGTIVSHRVPEYSLVCGIATTSTGTKDWNMATTSKLGGTPKDNGKMIIAETEITNIA
ncbi:DNA helicase [Tanacetum coccineum]